MLPILYQNHDFILYSYPLLMGLGWGIAYQIFFSKPSIPQKFAQILYWGIFVSSWIGSKFFFYLTTTSANKEELILNASFWTGGGFVFYGGLIFGLLFLSLYKAFKGPLDLPTVSSLLLALTAGHAIGRVGCFLAGCCYGSETTLWWGVDLHGSHRHPTQILEALGLLVLFFFLVKTKPSLKNLGLYFTGYGLLRFCIECLRGDLIRGQWGLFTPSQWISLGLIFLGTTLYFFINNKKLGDSKPF